MGFPKLYHDFVKLFAGRYGNYNSVVIWSLSIDIFEILGYVMLVIRIILLTFEYRLKTLYWCFWYFQKRKGDSFSSEMAFIFQMTYIKVFKFLAAVRGYHYYRRFWIPQKHQILKYFFENHNLSDCFAIKVYMSSWKWKCSWPSSSRNIMHYKIFSWIGETLSVLS